MILKKNTHKICVKTNRKEYFKEYNKTRRDPNYAKNYYKRFGDIIRKKEKLRRIKNGWKPKVYKFVDNKLCYKCKKENLPLMLHCKLNMDSIMFVENVIKKECVNI